MDLGINLKIPKEQKKHVYCLREEVHAAFPLVHFLLTAGIEAPFSQNPGMTQKSQCQESEMFGLTQKRGSWNLDLAFYRFLSSSTAAAIAMTTTTMMAIPMPTMVIV